MPTIPLTEQTCYVCGLSLPLHSFHSNPKCKTGYRRECKSCVSEYGKRYRERNKDFISTRRILKYSENVDAQRAAARERTTLRRYGMTREKVESLVESQNGKCAICLTEFSTLDPKNRHVDHDHFTGAIRGVLCADCNHLLGIAEDDTRRLESAIAYLGGD